jgi:hypothetical protein
MTTTDILLLVFVGGFWFWVGLVLTALECRQRPRRK